MSSHFVAARPLQACKLVAVLGGLGFAAIGYVQVVPALQLAALLFVPVLGFGVGLVVAVETLVACYRLARADESATARATARPVYAVVRVGEAAIAVLGIAAAVAFTASIPEGPMSGPGAFGLALVLFGIGVVVIAASLVRALTEYVYHRRTNATREDAGREDAGREDATPDGG